MKETLGNAEWMRKNEDAIKKLLPDTWTHAENLNGIKIGFGLKLLGVNWTSADEFGRVMVYLEKIGILQRRNEFQVRANHLSIFAR